MDFLADFLAALRIQEKPRISVFSILVNVARHEAGTWQVELDKALSGAMGPQCETLEKEGLLSFENRKRQGSRAARWVTLTPKGVAMVALLLNPTGGQPLIP